MSRTQQPNLANPEAGGITIIVALMLLVLLTIAAVGMSRNTLRELVSSGFTRQGSMARNIADSGIEWSIHWLDPQNEQVPTAGPATQLTNLKAGLLSLDTLSGVARDINTKDFTINPTLYAPGGTLQADLTLSAPTGVTQGFTIGLTRMGKLPITDMSQGAGSGAFAPSSGTQQKQPPDLWAVRSDAQVIQGGVTFIHAKEAWISTPVQIAQ